MRGDGLAGEFIQELVALRVSVDGGVEQAAGGISFPEARAGVVCDCVPYVLRVAHINHHGQQEKLGADNKDTGAGFEFMRGVIPAPCLLSPADEGAGFNGFVGVVSHRFEYKKLRNQEVRKL